MTKLCTRKPMQCLPLNVSDFPGVLAKVMFWYIKKNFFILRNTESLCTSLSRYSFIWGDGYSKHINLQHQPLQKQQWQQLLSWDCQRMSKIYVRCCIQQLFKVLMQSQKSQPPLLSSLHSSQPLLREAKNSGFFAHFFQKPFSSLLH